VSEAKAGRTGEGEAACHACLRQPS
jgi:hypothetical protein